jgi:dolichyl-phosphate-mannose-protein mannosyltransferase
LSRKVAGVVALASGAWALALYLGYGQSIDLGPIHISSRNPSRPFWIFLVALAGYAWVGGWSGLRRDGRRVVSTLQAIGVATVHTYERAERLNARLVALMLVLFTIAVSMYFRDSTAGGSDAFSYVTQADLWLERAPGLRIEMPIAAAAPWPDAFSTFVPFGYRKTSDGRAIVPVTAPGLSLIMALFKAIGGHCAMFIVVPLTAGLLVWSTFEIGRRLDSDALGLGAAWLAATSPTFLMFSHAIMSDVPAAACWALSVALVVRRSVRSNFAAGVSASAALLIRSNLMAIAVVVLVWTVWREVRWRRNRGWRAPIAFAAGLLPAVVSIALMNRWLYGSASASGYGSLSGLFSTANIPINLRHFTTWLADTQTPLALAGLASLLVPVRWLWPTSAARAGAALLAGVTLGVLAVYIAYISFEEWWYLRFLLPAWPAIFIGTVALLRAPVVAHPRAAWLRLVVAGIIVALGIRGIQQSMALGVYPPNEGERRYATIAELVQRVTEPNAAIVTTAHVGPLRYYASRLTVRYDIMDPAWLDRAVEWLQAQGRHPYILLEEQEVDEFRARFAARNRLGRLEMSPILVYEAYRIPGRVYLYDPLNPSAETWQPAPIADPQPRCPRIGDSPRFAIIAARGEK